MRALIISTEVLLCWDLAHVTAHQFPWDWRSRTYTNTDGALRLLKARAPAVFTGSGRALLAGCEEKPGGGRRLRSRRCDLGTFCKSERLERRDRGRLFLLTHLHSACCHAVRVVRCWGGSVTHRRSFRAVKHRVKTQANRMI